MVCTANICRSPMAEYEMRRLAPGLKVSSAGIAAMVDDGADKTAVAVARKSELDLSPHIARQISDDVIFGHDLIIVMDEGHFNWMRSAYPEDRARIVKLMHWMGGHDIPDPYRRSVLVYEAVFRKIQQGCAEWCRQLNLSTTEK
ncbi:MAG TPA: protein tyrosine phosphatase [Spongiibacteraceae bacterium]|nr:protein tyrosine phosphatase [Spongiibacteraceae bacterium]HCS28866.1 protein tyrosine phosphatase [Spongiibacteraceae bacterium]